MASINEKLDREYATGWKPRQDDKLIGVVVALDTYDAGYGDYPIVTVRKDDGEELAWHAFHDVAKAKVADADLKLGDQVGIKYRGLTANKGGTGRYHDYALVVERDDTATSDVPVDPTTFDTPAVADDSDDVPF